MKENLSFSDVALVEEYIRENYDLRYNVLSGHMEMSGKPMTDRDRQDIILSARDKFPDITGVKSIVQELLGSTRIREYNPVDEFLKGLPSWDGNDHVSELMDHIPGICDEQRKWIRTWLRSLVAQWREGDELFGNQCVLTLIGAQGCRKSSFLRLLLPKCLREYYLDHINLGNAFSRDMALTNNLIVNIDEMDQIKSCQQAELKFSISQPVVNSRPIYGRQQVKRKRYASFVATTNSPHPLQDATGSRRFLCVQIPFGRIIDVETALDYGQLYAQIADELDNQHLRTWFTDDEVAEIQSFKTQFQNVANLGQMLEICFRKPESQEEASTATLKDIVGIVTTQFPNSVKDKSLDVRLGILLSQQGYEKQHTRTGNVYNVVRLVA